MDSQERGELLGWVIDETQELVNLHYLSEVLSSPTEKYKHLEASIASTLLRTMSNMHKKLTGDALPLDELMPELGTTFLFREGTYNSVEFLRAIMQSYERELERYKELRTGEITKEMRMSAEIDGMGKHELVLAISRAQGIDIVDANWPCETIDGELFAADEEQEKAYVPGDDRYILWPVTRFKDSKTEFEPLVNYPGDIMKALYLASDLKSDGFARETKESLVDKTYTCSFYRETPYKTLVSGSSKFLPVAICKAYLKVMLFELNTDAQKRVFKEGDLDAKES